MLEKTDFKKLSIIVMLILLVVLSAVIVWPILSSIITGLILSYIFYPVYKRVKGVIREKNISALLIVLFSLLLIIVPIWLLLPTIIKQVFEIYLYIQKVNLLELFKTTFPSLASTNFSNDFVLSLSSFISSAASGLFSSASSIVINLPSLILKLVVIFFVFFFGLRDAGLFLDYFKTLSPFSKATEKDLLLKFEGITNAVIYGFIVVGILQGLLTGIGLFIFGVPNFLPLTLLAIFAAIIPIVGAWIVWVPASIYLIVSDHVALGVGLALYGAIFVSWIDNIIRPYLVAKRINISSGIVFIGMIGGLIIFGILGLILGPLILAYLLLVLDAYRKNTFPGLFSVGNHRHRSVAREILRKI